MDLKHRTEFESTLFIVESPFQCLCMLEAINHFEIKNFKVFVIYSDKYSLNSIRSLLNNYGIRFDEFEAKHLLLDSFRILRIYKKRRYSSIFLGDCFANKEPFAYLLFKFKGQLYYLDDGNSTICRLTESESRKINNSWRVSLFLYFTKIFSMVKCIKSPIYFSIFYNVKGNFNVEPNTLEYLITKKSHTSYNENSGDIFIIGTNSSALSFYEYSYQMILSILHKYLVKEFPYSKYYYCPHRRDANNSSIENICHSLGFEIFNTSVSIEYDFIKKNINPLVVIGFNSTALYTLHLIYKNAKIFNIAFKLKDTNLDKDYDLIRTVYQNAGITTFNLFEKAFI